MNDEAVYRTAPATPGLLNIAGKYGPVKVAHQQITSFSSLNVFTLNLRQFRLIK